MRDTAQAWRAWCRQNGIGEIYLFVTHSFGPIDPREYGCDAAVEFPPNASNAPDITSAQKFLNRNFEGHVYDWSVFVERSRDYKTPPYSLFRGVCPSWDNEARKPGKGAIYVNSSPEGYDEWLQNAVLETRRRIKNSEERLVFINAWNEWAEGAHLEPDRRFGYAYLEATRVALARAYSKSRKTIFDPATARIAIIIHVYYMDVFVEILESLGEIDARHKLIVTTIAEHEDEVRAILTSAGISHEIQVYENRGRDVLPFLNALRSIDFDTYPFILKLHTKKSPHRGDGATWRQQACSCLALPAQRAWILKQLCAMPDVGMVGPHDHLISMSFYIGSNLERVSELAARLGVAVDLERDYFVAGTMFFARSEALRPLMNIALDANDFEPEEARLDGTMAHAIERIFAYSATAAGFAISSANVGDAERGAAMRRIVNREFAFAAQS